MRCRAWLVLGGLLLCNAPLQASEMPAAAASTATPTKVKQQLRQRDREIGDLKRQVGQQESKSRQANERLQQQEQAIADLQHQLEAVQKAAPVTGQQENPPKK